MWTDLICHFEKGSIDLCKMDLHKSWENITMNMGEHLKCYNCDRVGHMSKHCKMKRKRNNIVATNENENVIDCYLKTFIDSGSSCHTVTDLNLLEPETITQTCKEVNSVDGSKIKLTHVGVRIIRTKQGIVKLTGVYFGEKLKYNLISVQQLVSKGVKLILGEREAYIEKGNTRITLEKVDNLWALPQHPKNKVVATLRMKIGGKTNARTWHKRLGHPSSNKLNHMIKRGDIPKDAAGFDSVTCQTCKLAYPWRRPVPKIAERSGETTVQVDYMSLGHSEKGWKGETGAYVFSHRTNKIIKVYPVKTANVNDALSAVDHYLTHILYKQ